MGDVFSTPDTGYKMNHYLAYSRREQYLGYRSKGRARSRVEDILFASGLVSMRDHLSDL